MFNGLCYLLSRPERNEKYLRKRELKSCGNRLSLDTNVTLVRAFSRPVPEDGDRTPWVVSTRAEGSGQNPDNGSSAPASTEGQNRRLELPDWSFPRRPMPGSVWA